MKQAIKDRIDLIKNITDSFTRSVSHFCEYSYGDDAGNWSIDRNSGATRQQIHELAKMIRREVLALDKDVQKHYESGSDGLGR